MKMIFDEWYGEVSYAQRRAYKKYNVSPSDHSAILMYFRENRHADITRYVTRNAEENGGMFSVYSMHRDVWDTASGLY